jgi:hypothetical protein
VTTEQAAELAEYTNQLFGGHVTPEQCGWLASNLLNSDFTDAHTTIDAHRAANEKLRIPSLMHELREKQNKRSGGNSSSRRVMTWCDVVRQHSHHLAHCGDVETILRTFRAWWCDSRCSRSDAYRHQFTDQTETHLLHAGVPKEQIPALVASVFDPSPEFFRRVLAEVRDAWPGRAGSNVPEPVGAEHPF